MRPGEDFGASDLHHAGLTEFGLDLRLETRGIGPNRQILLRGDLEVHPMFVVGVIDRHQFAHSQQLAQLEVI